MQIGKKSSIGRMGNLILGENDPTPLQLKLNDVAETIGTYGTIAAISIVCILFAKFAWTKFHEDNVSLSVHYDEIIGYILIGVI